MTLTAAQDRVKHLLEQAWNGLAVPTVVQVAAPAYRGKTHVVQAFYESLALQPATLIDAVTGPTPLPSWLVDSEWRLARKRLTAPPVREDGAVKALWLGVTAAPGVTDVLLPLRQEAEQVLNRCDEGLLPPTALNAVRPALAGELGRVAALAVGKVALDRLPFYGSVEALTSGIAEASRLWRRGPNSSEVLREAVERSPAQQAVAMLALVRLLSPLHQAPALPGTVLVIENAELLHDREFRVLTDLLTVNPDDVLAQQLLPPNVYRPLKALGVPPRIPLLILLLETTSSGSDPFLGPMGELRQRAPAEERTCDPWMKRWSDAGVETVRSINELPLLTEDEALNAASHLCPETSQQVRRIIVDRSADVLLGGYSPALLKSHIQRVSTLIDPDTTVTQEWAARELPDHLRAELEHVADRLTVDARVAVTTGALLGHGFASSSVNEMLDQDVSTSLATAERLGVLHRQRQVEDAFYTFDDSMTRGYFYGLGSGDQELSWRVLDRHDASKVRWLLKLAPPFHTEEAQAIASLGRQALWEYRSLTYDADLIERSSAHRDVWIASLTLGADLDMIRAETGNEPARERLRWLWEQGSEAGPQEREDLRCWSVTSRWLAHRNTPGAMTPGALFAAAKTSSPPSSVTRTLPAAHEQALRRMSQLLAMQEPNFLPGWFDVQYAARLAHFCRRLDGPSRKRLADALLRVAPISMTAANLLVGELAQDLSSADRARAIALLNGWARILQGRDQLKAIAVLGSSGSHTAVPPGLLKLGIRAIEDGIADDPFSDFEISGSIVDGSAPTSYPWYGLRPLLCQAVLRARGTQMIRSEFDLIARTLWREATRHPSSLALLEMYFPDGMSRRRRQDLHRLKAQWLATQLVGICEQAGLLVLRQDV